MMRILRRALVAALIAAMAVSLAAVGFAEAALGSYVERKIENGNIDVSFGEVEVTLPVAWTDKYDIFSHDTYALFCHRDSCRLWAETRGIEESGVLFSLNVSQGTDYTNLPSYMDIGTGTKGNYFMAFPTDLQAYVQDEAVAAEYEEMWGDIEFVMENARVVEMPAEAVEEAAPEAEAQGAPGAELGELVEIPEEIPEVEPAPVIEPMPEAEPEPIEEPAAEPEAEPEPAIEPMPEAEPEAVEEPVAEPEAEPEPAIEPMPEAEPEPIEEPAAEAEAEPEPDIEPMPEVEPEPIEEPAAEPEVEAIPEAEPAPGTAGDELRSIVYDEASAPYDGVWVTFDDGFQLLLPGEWLSYEITEEQSAAGLFFRAGNDGSDSVVGEVPMGVAVSYVEAGGLTTLDDLMRDFESVGFTNLEKLDLNGIPALFFIKPDEDYCGVAFYHAVYPEYVMAIYATPIGEASDAVAAVNDAILSSLKPYTPQE